MKKITSEVIKDLWNNNWMLYSAANWRLISLTDSLNEVLLRQIICTGWTLKSERKAEYINFNLENR